jgi:hypothetical protein
MQVNAYWLRGPEKDDDDDDDDDTVNDKVLAESL